MDLQIFLGTICQSFTTPTTLQKKSNAICYHAMQEAVAMGECVTSHVRSEDNVADIATKIIPGGIKRQRLVSMLLYDIANYQ